MYSKYDRSRTYDMSNDIQVMYGQAIRDKSTNNKICMYYGTNKKRCSCTTVRIIEMRMYYGMNKKPG
jgi:hypothetical protein